MENGLATRRESCPILACAAGLAGVAICSLYERGWALAGPQLDVVPCLMSALMIAFLVWLAGGLAARPQAWLSAGFTIAALAGGKVLAWDLPGVMHRWTGDSLMGANWQQRLLAAWHELSPAARSVNLVCYLVTPILAALVVPAAQILDRRWGRWHDRFAAVPPRSTRDGAAGPRSRLTVIMTVVWIGIVLVFHVASRAPEGSGFLRMTFPAVPATDASPLPGFASLLGGRPVMAETVPAQEQVAWFSGSIRSDNNFRFLRSGYAFLAVHLVPLFDREGSLLAINLIAWIAAMIAVWHVAERFYRDPLSSAVATCLAAAGCGFLFHLDASTPHLLSFALYFGGLLAILESRVGDVTRPWLTHARLGLTFGLTSLVYNVALMLLMVYLLMGVRRQRWTCLLGATLVTLAFGHIWRWILPAIGINVIDVEGEYLQRAIAGWGSHLQQGLFPVLVALARYVAEAVTACESPLMLLFGLIGLLFFLPPGRHWFAFLSIAAPTAACTLFAPSATARGYIVYGFSLLLFVTAGRSFALACRRSVWSRRMALIVLCLCFATQLVWGTAHFWNRHGPIVTYFQGWDDGWPALRHGAAQVASLTGEEPVPVLFGGSGLLRDAHATLTEATRPVQRRSRVLALLARLPFVVGLAALCCAWWRPARQRRIAVLSLVCGLLLATEVSYRGLGQEPNPFDIHRAVHLAAGERLQLDIAVSELTWQQLEQHLRHEGQRCALFVAAEAGVQVELAVNGKLVPLRTVRRHHYEVDRRIFLEDHPPAAQLSVRLHNRNQDSAWVTGWQSVATPGRTIVGGGAGSTIPAVELRVYNVRDAFLHFAAF